MGVSCILNTVQNAIFHLFLVLVAVVGVNSRRGGGRPGGRPGGKPHGPPYMCNDGTKASCKCESKPCGSDNPPTCTCDDGSTPKVEAPCDNGNFPVCEEGSCKDGSAAVLNDDPFNNPPCADGSRPKLHMCECE